MIYTLEINPESHVRATHDDRKSFYIFGPLAGHERSPKEEAMFQDRKTRYPHLYKRFLQLVRYNDYKRRLLDEAARKGFYLRDDGMKIDFYMPVPKSWRQSKKEKMHLQGHKPKPDVDNLLKALFDTIRPHCDSSIYQLTGLGKYWINEPKGFIQIELQHCIPAIDKPTDAQLRIQFPRVRRK